MMNIFGVAEETKYNKILVGEKKHTLAHHTLRAFNFGPVQKSDRKMTVYLHITSLRKDW